MFQIRNKSRLVDSLRYNSRFKGVLAGALDGSTIILATIHALLK